MSSNSSQKGIVQSARLHNVIPGSSARSFAPEFKRSSSGTVSDLLKQKPRTKPKNFTSKQFDNPELEPNTEDVRRKSPYSNSFVFERSIFLGELGDGKLMRNTKNPNGSKVILKTFSPSNTKDRDQLIRQLKFYKQLDCASMVRVLDFEVRTESAYCSVNYFVDAYLEHFDKTLEMACKERQPSHMLFSNESLERLLYDVGFALHHFCKHNIVHGCVDGRHIGVQEVEGEIIVAKLLPLIGLDDNPLQLYRKNILFQTEHTVAPEIFDQAKLLFKNEFDTSDIDFLKLDAFSLGLLVLRTGLLESVMKVYAKPVFDEDALAFYLRSFEEVFGDGIEGNKLVNAVKNLVQRNFSERLYPSEVLQQLNAIDSKRLTKAPEFLDWTERESSVKVKLAPSVSQVTINPENFRADSPRSQERDEPNKALPANFLAFHTVQPTENPLHRKFANTGSSSEALSVRELSKDSRHLSKDSTQWRPPVPSHPVVPPVVLLAQTQNTILHGGTDTQLWQTQSSHRSGSQRKASARLPLVDMSLYESAKSLRNAQRYSATKSKYKTSPDKYAPLLHITPDTLRNSSAHKLRAVRTNLFANNVQPNTNTAADKTAINVHAERPLSARVVPAPVSAVVSGLERDRVGFAYSSLDSNIPKPRRSVSAHGSGAKQTDISSKFIQQFSIPSNPIQPGNLFFENPSPPTNPEHSQNIHPLQNGMIGNPLQTATVVQTRDIRVPWHRRSRTEIPQERNLLVTPVDEYYARPRMEQLSRPQSFSRLPPGTLDSLLNPRSATLAERNAQKFNEEAQLIRSRSASETNKRHTSQGDTASKPVELAPCESGKSSTVMPAIRPQAKSGDLSLGSDAMASKTPGTQTSTRHPTDVKISLNIEAGEIGVQSADKAAQQIPVPGFWGRSSYRSHDGADSGIIQGDRAAGDEGVQTPLLMEPKTPPSSFGGFGRSYKPQGASNPKSALQALLCGGRQGVDYGKPSQATTANVTRINQLNDSRGLPSPFTQSNRHDSQELRSLRPGSDNHHSFADTSGEISFVRREVPPPGRDNLSREQVVLEDARSKKNLPDSLQPAVITEEAMETFDSRNSGPSAPMCSYVGRTEDKGDIKHSGSQGTPSVTPRESPEEKAPGSKELNNAEASGYRHLERGWRKAESKVMDDQGQGSSEETEEDIKRIRRELKERKLQYESIRDTIRENSNLSPEDIEAEIQRRLGELAEYFDKQLSFESDPDKGFKRNSFRGSSSIADSEKYSPSFIKQRPSPFKGIETSLLKYQSLNDSKPIQIEPNYLIDKSQTMDPAAKSYVTPNWVDLECRSPSPSQQEAGRPEQDVQDDVDELKHLIITRKESSSILDERESGGQSPDPPRSAPVVPSIVLPGITGSRLRDTPVFVRVRGPDDPKDDFCMPQRQPLSLPVTGGLLLPPTALEVEPQILSARSIQVSPNKLLRPFLAAASPSPSKFKDRFTRLDQNNELEFLYAEYFAAD